MCVCRGVGVGGGDERGVLRWEEGGEQGTISSSYCVSLAVGGGGWGVEWGDGCVVAWFLFSHNTFFFNVWVSAGGGGGVGGGGRTVP